MDITVAVVVYNGAGCIRPCLESLLRQAPRSGATEILVVDGCSNDGTQTIVREFGERVRLVENPVRTIASSRNVALREARHLFIAFTDADCVVPHDWLCALQRGWEETVSVDSHAAGVGGGNVAPTAEANSPFSVALGIALNSFLGSLGSVQGKVFGQRRAIASLAGLNVLYSRAALEAVGGFDEQLANMCEDTDINYRLSRKGYTLYFVPGADVQHDARQNLRAWCGNMYAYGVGRARIMRKHRTFFSPAYVIAMGFLPVLAMGSVIGIFWPWAWLVWLYIPLMIGAGFALAGRRKSFAGGRVAVILLGTHLCYALGLWRGFISVNSSRNVSQ